MVPFFVNKQPLWIYQPLPLILHSNEPSYPGLSEKVLSLSWLILLNICSSQRQTKDAGWSSQSGLWHSSSTDELEFVYSSVKVKSESESHSVVSDSLQPHGLYSPWISPGQNTVVGSLSHLQGIFPTQWSNPGLPHCRWILYQLSHKGSPRILEWVTYPFSSGFSRPRNQTGVSCIAGGFLTNWTIREVYSSVVFWI